MRRCLAWIDDPPNERQFCDGSQTYRDAPQAFYHNVTKCIARSSAGKGLQDMYRYIHSEVRNYRCNPRRQ